MDDSMKRPDHPTARRALDLAYDGHGLSHSSGLAGAWPTWETPWLRQIRSKGGTADLAVSRMQKCEGRPGQKAHHIPGTDRRI